MSTDAKRYYAVLGVDPLASAEAIHVAFRRRAKELHPDAQSGDATAFILLKRAYDTLHNPVDRAAYDRVCAPAPPIDPPAPHADSYRRAQPMPAPPFPHAKRPRRSAPRRSISIRRYVVAFIIMATISLGGVQAMIMLTEAPPSIRTRASGKQAEVPGATPTPAVTSEPSPAPGSSKSGFWDADPAPTRRK
ncbi:MAG: J domain-containing protein [Alphaproteobacteria bacterium]|nr:MAG: J domain-containing protein [Alphaproteobacteria bacterium]